MYTVRDDLRPIAAEVITGHGDLSQVNPDAVVYIASDKPKKRANGGTIYADCTKVSDKYKALIGFDFIVTMYKDAEEMSPQALKALLWHELKHIGYKDGAPYLVPHDLEDFKAIIDAYGTDWATM